MKSWVAHMFLIYVVITVLYDPIINIENVESQICEEQQDVSSCSVENFDLNIPVITINPENDHIQNSDNNGGISGGHNDLNVDAPSLIIQYELLNYIALSDRDSGYL